MKQIGLCNTNRQYLHWIIEPRAPNPPRFVWLLSHGGDTRAVDVLFDFPRRVTYYIAIVQIVENGSPDPAVTPVTSKQCFALCLGQIVATDCPLALSCLHRLYGPARHIKRNDCSHCAAKCQSMRGRAVM